MRIVSGLMEASVEMLADDFEEDDILFVELKRGKRGRW